MDTLGRKFFLCFSMLLSGASAFLIYLVNSATMNLILSCIFGAVSTMGFNSLDCLGIELFPTSLRSTAMAVTLTETEYESEKFYLCQMFGEGSRFVDFTNLTGRYLRLSGRLELTQLSHMAWTTAVTLAPRATHVWRFLGRGLLLIIFSSTHIIDINLENLFS